MTSAASPVMNDFNLSATTVPLGLGFESALNPQDFVTLTRAVSQSDAAVVVACAQGCLERLLNVWASKMTADSDMFTRLVVPFPTKVMLCGKLGMPSGFGFAFNQFNALADAIQLGEKLVVRGEKVLAMATAVDTCETAGLVGGCASFAQTLALDEQGISAEGLLEWATADAAGRLAICFLTLNLKFVSWMLAVLDARDMELPLEALALQRPH